jgi:hypothetical protein
VATHDDLPDSCPYGAFASLLLLTSAKVSVFVAAAICVAVIALDFMRGRSLKWLGAGSAILFASVGLYLTLIDPALGNSAAKLAVDTGIFAISLASMLMRRPFTLQYALEAVPAETAGMPGFLRANYIITAAWTAAALVMMLANLAMLYVPGLPIWSGLAIAFAARNSAVYFTKWYPPYRRAKYGTAPEGAVPTT